MKKCSEKARAGKFFMCRSGSELPRRARANLEKSRGKMFDGFGKVRASSHGCPLTPGPSPAGGRGGNKLDVAKSPAERCARENVFSGGAGGSCGERCAQIWKSRVRKCLTVSKKREHNGWSAAVERRLRHRRSRPCARVTGLPLDCRAHLPRYSYGTFKSPQRCAWLAPL